MERVEICEKALGESRGRLIQVVGERVIKPGCAKDASIDVRWKVVIVNAGHSRRDRAKSRQRVAEEPMRL
jgi:hypothetical protein